jgi:hypothetical protein
VVEAAPSGYAPPVRLRVVKVYSSRIYGALADDDPLEDVDSSYWDLRVEPIPEDDLQTEAACRASGTEVVPTHVTHTAFVGGCHMTEDFGEPVLVWVAPDETVASLQRRYAAISCVCCGDAWLLVVRLWWGVSLYLATVLVLEGESVSKHSAHGSTCNGACTFVHRCLSTV